MTAKKNQSVEKYLIHTKVLLPVWGIWAREGELRIAVKVLLAFYPVLLSFVFIIYNS
jgi:hypothetical protein